ncbi:hypothetical protein B0H63DRAFT_47786 [Podospora didyma]|uniref:Glycoside Hydrolase Family 76 n=1 Tax=Podospora didyma TaxID=330526 RepID=A0AAE0P711_9PEZI|nr:hypothetical protein B0H63DRAFT_47786 [Podospora didyma]
MLVKWVTTALAFGTLASGFSLFPLHLPSRFREGDAVKSNTATPDLQLFEDTFEALRVLQDAYFQPWVGTWPSAIDWTAAVMGTHVTGALQSLSRDLELYYPTLDAGYSAKENAISLYFSQLVSFYFGQDAFSIRNQAFDDMLWVVLGWIDTIKFIKVYSRHHYEKGTREEAKPGALWNQSWYGNAWTPVFAHRARIFWELAATGWDTKLCGGGMNWNPKLTPYKNAITNELYIAGSIAMYLYFPGDKNAAPFNFGSPGLNPGFTGSAEWSPHDPKYLEAALNGYKWLIQSNMTNDQGLYADGFHISGNNSGSNNTKCDERDEMVYTYNQGVVLSGQLGLFKVTGDAGYLREGHRLIENVIRATGYDLDKESPVDNISKIFPGQIPPWHGLGRAGVLEDACDIIGKCSQDGQTFKGIWMHHFTSFCAILEPFPNIPVYARSFGRIQAEHSAACQRYIGWLRHNAVAARGTRDGEGKFGMWWTIGLLDTTTMLNIKVNLQAMPEQDGAVDYRNYGVPHDSLWIANMKGGLPNVSDEVNKGQHPIGKAASNDVAAERESDETAAEKTWALFPDPNSRGRGRTVETQGGGLAVLRALWELSKQSL